MRHLGLLCFSTLACACAREGTARTPTPRPSPRIEYERSLERAGAAGTAAVQDWLAAGAKALGTAADVRPPFRESAYFSAERPGAVAYRFELVAGQRLVARTSVQTATPGEAFLDLFGSGREKPVTGARGVEPVLEFTAERGGTYTLRLQPELMRGGRYTVSVEIAAAVLFPVLGRDARAIVSYFGDSRDDGDREHEGVDILAPRGTPAIAAAAGRVTAVQNTPVGGKVVWLQDAARDVSLYYAHLDSQRVSAGAELQQGDTVGFVGNTGNARGASPHLHFGVYEHGRRAIDPMRLLRGAGAMLGATVPETALVGRFARVARTNVRLRSGPDERAEIHAELPRATPLRVTGGAMGWYRVELPDGQAGYISSPLVESAETAIDSRSIARDTPILDAPDARAAVIQTLGSGSSVAIMGEFRGYAWVQTAEGFGWLERDGK